MPYSKIKQEVRSILRDELQKLKTDKSSAKSNGLLNQVDGGSIVYSKPKFGRSRRKLKDSNKVDYEQIVAKIFDKMQGSAMIGGAAGKMTLVESAAELKPKRKKSAKKDSDGSKKKKRKTNMWVRYFKAWLKDKDNRETVCRIRKITVLAGLAAKDYREFKKMS